MAGHPFLNSRKKILWIEDEPQYRAEVAIYLESTGRLEVISRENAIRAVEALRDNPRIDLILSDHKMVPRGGELVRAAIQFGIPLVVLTGSFKEAVGVLQSYTMKIPILRKPFALSRLLEVIEHHLFGHSTSNSPVLSAWWNEEDSD